MDLDKRPAPSAPPAREGYEPGDGCLTTAIRIPVRIVVLVLVVPVRMVWDLLAAGARALHRSVFRPFGRGTAFVCSWVYEALLAPLGRALGVVLGWLGKALFVWPWVALWRYVLVPVVHYGLVVPLVWLYRQVLTPVGHGTLWSLTWLGRGIALIAAGIGTALGWLVVTLLITPLGWFHRAVLAPVGREIAAAFGVAWRIAGQISRAVGRALKWLAWILIGQPVSWFYRAVCTPVGHLLRDHVRVPARSAAIEAGRAVGSALRSAGETVRQARRDAWRALVGPPRPAEPVAWPVDGARTLGSTTTVPGAVPAPEISLRKQV
ncbi:hypothetical protein [Streptomyces sp. S4.7]|uniref:hypothetical protein n=1 Tax=Streptomyces sp. S4.7 TaxID=2705439 RepID=UPI0013DA6733|nr:hypothetical protein [Streptomyces sp. S4.7]